MTGDEMLKALPERGGLVVVVTKSGKAYDVERDVVTANSDERDPYIYGWPIHGPRRNRTRPRWFFARNVRLAEADDVVNI